MNSRNLHKKRKIASIFSQIENIHSRKVVFWKSGSSSDHFELSQRVCTTAGVTRGSAASERQWLSLGCAICQRGSAPSLSAQLQVHRGLRRNKGQNTLWRSRRRGLLPAQMSLTWCTLECLTSAVYEALLGGLFRSSKGLLCCLQQLDFQHRWMRGFDLCLELYHVILYHMGFYPLQT